MKNSAKNNTKEEEKRRMAALAKPVNRVSVIQEKDSRKFVRNFNKNKVSEEFLDSCKKAGKLFGKRK